MATLDELLAARAAAAPASAPTTAPATAPASASAPSIDDMLALRASGATVPNGASPVAPAPVGRPLGFGESFFKGLNDISTAGGQMLAHALPQGAVDAVNSATQYVNNLPGIGPITQALGMVPATVQQVDQNAKEGEAQYQANRQASVPQTPSGLATGQKASPGIDWGRIGGNVLGTLPLTAAEAPAALAKAPALAKILLQGGAVSSLSQPVTDGDFATEKSKQAMLGALMSGGTTVASNAIAPKVAEGVRTLMDSGVTPTIGQILGGTASRVEQAATSIPVLGDFIKNAQRRAVGDLNTAAVNRSLSPIGDELPDGTTGRDAIGYAANALGSAYNAVVSKIGAVKPDEPFLANLANLQGMTTNMPKASADQFGRILDTEILGRIDANGMMTGEGMKAAESNLGQLARGYSGSADFDQRQLGTAVQQAQAELRTMLGRVQPENAAELKAINEGYANLMPVQRAAASVGAEGGTFTAAQLQSAVKANDPSRNNRAFATGNAMMQDLSEAGKSVLGSTLPDSGTPYRHGVQALAAAMLGHGLIPDAAQGYVIPAAIGGGLATLPYTSAGQKIASILLTKRPTGADQLAALLENSAPYAALAAPALAPGTK